MSLWVRLLTIFALLAAPLASWADKVSSPSKPASNSPPPKVYTPPAKTATPANGNVRLSGTAPQSSNNIPVRPTPRTAVTSKISQPVAPTAKAAPSPATGTLKLQQAEQVQSQQQQQKQLEQKKLFAQKQHQQKLSAQKEAESKARLAKLRAGAVHTAGAPNGGSGGSGNGGTRQAANDNPAKPTGPTLPGPNLKNPKLEPNVAASFKDGKYTNRQLAVETKLYRYHGIDKRTGKDTRNWKKVSWLSNRKYTSEAELRRNLAIRADWDVTITDVSEFRAPKGTWISEGVAADQRQGYSGGGYQIVIENIPNSWVVRTDKAF